MKLQDSQQASGMGLQDLQHVPDKIVFVHRSRASLVQQDRGRGSYHAHAEPPCAEVFSVSAGAITGVINNFRKLMDLGYAIVLAGEKDGRFAPLHPDDVAYLVENLDSSPVICTQFQRQKTAQLDGVLAGVHQSPISAESSAP